MQQDLELGLMLGRMDQRVTSVERAVLEVATEIGRMRRSIRNLKVQGMRVAVLLALWSLALGANLQPEELGAAAAAFIKGLLAAL